MRSFQDGPFRTRDFLSSPGHPPHRARVAKEIRFLAAIGPGWKCRHLSEEAFRVLVDAATSLGVASKDE